MIAAERTVDASATTLPPVVRAMEHGRLERVIVRGLSVAELERLLGIVLDMELPPSTLKRLHRTSGGNPFYAIEVAPRCSVGQGGGSARAAAAGQPVGTDPDRIGALSPAAADVVLHASALSQPTVGMIETAVGEDVASKGLAEAGEAGVLLVEAGVLRFAHPLLAAEAYAQAGADRRRAVIHRGRAGRRTGGTCEAHGPGGRRAGRHRGCRPRAGGRTRPPARCAGRCSRARRASRGAYPARRRRARRSSVSLWQPDTC